MKKLVIVLSIAVLFLTACGVEENTKGYKLIDANELKEMLKKEGDSFLVDVRTQEEFDASHIDLALNLSVDQIESKFASEITANKDATIIVYCRSGARSEQAALKLVEMGYTNVYDFGAITNWPYDLID